MLRKISYTFLFGLTLSTKLIAAPTVAITQATLGYDLPAYTLAPNEPLTLANTLFWEVKATCVINTKADENKISIQLLSKNGTLNGVPVKEGTSLELSVHNNDRLAITADRGAKVSLTNLGPNELIANCSIK